MSLVEWTSIFVRVAEGSTISAAAKEHRVSQAHASRSLQSLEEHLGCSLLRRTTRRSTLTPEGERYLVAGRRLLAAVDEATDSVRETLTGTVRVTAPVGFGQVVIAPLLDDFANAHPNVRLEFQLTDSFVDLVSAGMDVAFRLGQLHASSLRARKLGEMRRHLVASPAYLDAHPAVRHPRDVARHELLSFTGQQTSRLRLDRRGQVAWVDLRGRRASNHLPTLRDWTLAGRGITVLPGWLVAQDLTKNRLRIVLPSWTPSSLPVHVLLHSETHRSARTTTFVETVAEGLRQALT
ncbi:MAG: LysR family transcriptional regulator [Myxococcota bacterium]